MRLQPFDAADNKDTKPPHWRITLVSFIYYAYRQLSVESRSKNKNQKELSSKTYQLKRFLRLLLSAHK